MDDLVLDPPALRDAARRLGDFLAGYEQDLASRPVFPALDRRVIDDILREPLPEEGRPLAALFDELEAAIVPNSTQIAHPRFLAYVLASPASVAIFAEAAAAALNQNCNVWTISPAANAIEQRVVAWFGELFGLAGGGGIITSGGSAANLSALAVARDQTTARGPLVLYTSDEAHGSIPKGAAILGLDDVRRIPVDDGFRMRPELLAEAVAADRRAGRTPFCVVATAGTVTTGAIDPIPEVATFCEREGLWLHVDGAFGAFAVLSPRMRTQLSAAGLGDSLSLDPHKLLFMPLEAGCVLFRDTEAWRATFGTSHAYLGMPDDPDLIHFADYGPQLSRSFKALKVWWCLRAHGRRAYAAAIDRMLDLALYMGARVQEEPALELVAPVELTAVCLRASDLDDAANARILETLVTEGLAFLGPARVHGRLCLRACFTNLRTSRADVDAIVDELARLAQSHSGSKRRGSADGTGGAGSPNNAARMA
jgi:aromatic-L-amino-acid decarboxylase